jgi:hypothetical protein
VALGPLADGDHLLQHTEWPGLSMRVAVRDGGKVVFPRGARPASPVAQVAVELGPPTPVDVKLVAQGATVEARVESPDGEVLQGRTLAISASQGQVAGRTDRAGRTAFKIEGASGPITVTVVDLATQVAAVIEVRL